MDELWTDSKYFTSPKESRNDYFSPSSSLESGGSDGGSDTEHDLVLAILNRIKNEPDLVSPTSEEEINGEGEEEDQATFFVLKVKNLDE